MSLAWLAMCLYKKDGSVIAEVRFDFGSYFAAESLKLHLKTPKHILPCLLALKKEDRIFLGNFLFRMNSEKWFIFKNAIVHPISKFKIEETDLGEGKNSTDRLRVIQIGGELVDFVALSRPKKPKNTNLNNRR